MSKPRILVQLDADAHASVFDAVVAVDADIDHLLQYHAVAAEQVRDLVHGTMFTRGPGDLKNTAIFVGGSNVADGEQLLKQVTDTFFGPMRVSVMMDASGANTTAAAAVVAAKRHIDLSTSTTLVLAGTGPVGQRVARLLADAGATVRIGSRSQERAEQVGQTISAQSDTDSLQACVITSEAKLRSALDGVDAVIACGAAGVQLLSDDARRQAASLKVAIDLNAVPPHGIEGIQATDTGADQDGVVCYGAIGVGGTKMKIHKAALRKLFESNDQVLDAREIYAIGCQLDAS